ncbi:hypothetical protein Trydic_g17394 [Trypoxylus dichotomus]
MNVDWSFVEAFSNVDDAVAAFYDQLYGTLSLFVPSKSSQSNFPPWFNMDIKRNLKTKNYYYAKWRRTGSPAYRRESSRLRSLIKTQVKIAYKEYQKRIENDIC